MESFCFVHKERSRTVIKEIRRIANGQLSFASCVRDIVDHCLQATDHTNRSRRDSWGPVQRLRTEISRKRLIEEKGRVDGPGRAILYGTTEYFMDYFGLKSLAELPDIQAMEDELEEDGPVDLFMIVTKQEGDS